MKIKGAEHIIRLLELLDAGHLFAYPGGNVLPIYDALTNSSLNTVLVRHEQGAAFAAQGYARTMANKPGFCLATSGPGATNLVTGIADAYADSIPMIAITGQAPTNLIGTDAFQETDITGVCMPITKKTFLIKDIRDAAAIFQEAYEISISGRPGPVLIDIPKDVQNAEIELPDDWEEHYHKPVPERFYNAHPDAVDKATSLLYKAKKPLIIAGHGITISDAVDEFRHFVYKENIPVVSTILGIGTLPPSDTMYFSWLGMHGMKYANMAVQEADLILALGIRFDDRITGKLKTFAPNAHIIHVDIDESEGSKNVLTKVFLHADLKTMLKSLPTTHTRTNERDRQEWVDLLQTYKAQYPLKLVTDNHFTMTRSLAVLNEMTDDIIVTTDVGQHQMWAGQYMTKLSPYSFITSGGLGSMGFGLPAAMGAQAAQPHKEVWCISGDGSFMMNIQELMTIVQEKWPVKIIVMDNNYLGMVRQWQEQFYKRNYSGVYLLGPDFEKAAYAYGMPCASVDTLEDYREAIREAQITDGPYLIHAKVEKEENVFPMVPPQTCLSDTIYYPDHQEKQKNNTNEDNKHVAHKMQSHSGSH